MSKMSRAIAVLGVVAGLGVAALPMSTYASNTASKSAKVQVEVGGGISIALENPTDGSFDVDTNTLDLGEVKINGAPVSGVINVKVSTNDPAGYSLTIKSQSTETAMTSDNGSSIPAGEAAQGTSAWSFSGGDITNLTAIKATDQVLKANGATTDGDSDASTPADEVTPVTFAVSADASQPEGVYTGNVTFTATVK